MRPKSEASVGLVRRGGRRSQARKPGRPVRSRIASRLPSRARAAAICLGIGLVSLLGYLITGPLLVIERVEWQGNRFTSDATLRQRLQPLTGASLLVVDTRALSDQLAALPGVAAARVEATLPDSVSVTIQEDEPALVWQTPGGRLLATSEGALIAALPADGELPAGLAGLPVVDDRRPEADVLKVGDSLDAFEVRTALRLAGLNPALIGSVVPTVAVRIDELYGFTLVAPEPGWTAALGFYGREPEDDVESAAARLERQIGAVRTVFATQPEATVVWLDARNPGRVYFRASEG